jgi:hypothetical protein
MHRQHTARPRQQGRPPESETRCGAARQDRNEKAHGSQNQRHDPQREGKVRRQLRRDLPGDEQQSGGGQRNQRGEGEQGQQGEGRHPWIVKAASPCHTRAPCPPQPSRVPGSSCSACFPLGWGFNWPIMKVVITEIPRWIFRGDSILLASLGLFCIAWFSGQSLKVPAGRWPQLLGMASCNIVGWNMFAIYGVSLLPSGRAAILGYTMPIWSALLSVWFLDEKLTRRRVTGLFLGMAGMALLIGAEFENSAVRRSGCC